MQRTIQSAQLKEAVKEAVLELLQEHREVFQDMFAEAFEDMVLLRAMEEGRKTKLVPRARILDALRGK